MCSLAHLELAESGIVKYAWVQLELHASSVSARQNAIYHAASRRGCALSLTVFLLAQGHCANSNTTRCQRPFRNPFTMV